MQAWRIMTAKPAVAGDAFEQEVLQYLDGLYGYALHLTRNPEDASDLVQETYARAFRARSQYSLGTNARAWLFAILRNTFLNVKRADGRSPRTIPCEWIDELAEGDESELPIQRSADPHRCFLNSLLKDDIEKALSELPEEFRSAVVLCDVEEMPYAEIAEVLGVPIGTVRSRIHRGRAILQKKLQDWNKGAGRGDK
jgi:RNA polymerase sigma-70 factor (ECF subfamily)